MKRPWIRFLSVFLIVMSAVAVFVATYPIFGFDPEVAADPMRFRWISLAVSLIPVGGSIFGFVFSRQGYATLGTGIVCAILAAMTLFYSGLLFCL